METVSHRLTQLRSGQADTSEQIVLGQVRPTNEPNEKNPSEQTSSKTKHASWPARRWCMRVNYGVEISSTKRTSAMAQANMPEAIESRFQKKPSNETKPTKGKGMLAGNAKAKRAPPQPNGLSKSRKQAERAKTARASKPKMPYIWIWKYIYGNNWQMCLTYLSGQVARPSRQEHA